MKSEFLETSLNFRIGYFKFFIITFSLVSFISGFFYFTFIQNLIITLSILIIPASIAVISRYSVKFLIETLLYKSLKKILAPKDYIKTAFFIDFLFVLTIYGLFISEFKGYHFVWYDGILEFDNLLINKYFLIFKDFNIEPNWIIKGLLYGILGGLFGFHDVGKNYIYLIFLAKFENKENVDEDILKARSEIISFLESIFIFRLIITKIRDTSDFKEHIIQEKKESN